MRTASSGTTSGTSCITTVTTSPYLLIINIARSDHVLQQDRRKLSSVTAALIGLGVACVVVTVMGPLALFTTMPEEGSVSDVLGPGPEAAKNGSVCSLWLEQFQSGRPPGHLVGPVLRVQIVVKSHCL
uniref:Uncharacterized protein n=1 Tax=Anopheles merus TaxID=30066 RepID=A0A182VDG3_ANOME